MYFILYFTCTLYIYIDYCFQDLIHVLNNIKNITHVLKWKVTWSSKIYIKILTFAHDKSRSSVTKRIEYLMYIMHIWQHKRTYKIKNFSYKLRLTQMIRKLWTIIRIIFVAFLVFFL